MEDKTDYYMECSFKLAEESLISKEVPVGCVFVDIETNEVFSSGKNCPMSSKDGTRHAEMNALEIYTKINKRNRVAVYVTVEPCIMCSSALKYFPEIERVYFGCKNTKFGGCGSIINVDALYSSEWFIIKTTQLKEYEKRAILLLRRFYLTENKSAPKPKRKSGRVLKTD
eukprot:GHVP01047962.1.p1 GENE.GHVP01047962.1~~GHVP01047962.1.p1  ORF type:complete len:170 (+),score=32.51 GHVP01047962.1:423-932(+)